MNEKTAISSTDPTPKKATELSTDETSPKESEEYAKQIEQIFKRLPMGDIDWLQDEQDRFDGREDQPKNPL